MYVVEPQMFHFQVVRHIGAGGLGVVDEVQVVQSGGNPPVGSRFARKRLNARFAADPTQRARFEREIEQSKKLRHPRIVPYQGENVGGERCYLMPVYQESLRDWLSRNGAIEWRAAVACVLPVADALAYAHENNCVHRDIKPENILLDSQRLLYVTDWGLERRFI